MVTFLIICVEANSHFCLVCGFEFCKINPYILFIRILFLQNHWKLLIQRIKCNGQSNRHRNLLVCSKRIHLKFWCSFCFFRFQGVHIKALLFSAQVQKYFICSRQVYAYEYLKGVLLLSIFH